MNKQFDFAEYQAASRHTWQRVDCDHPLTYPTLGLANEAGEFAGKVKKILRDRDGVMTPMDREQLRDELGDVLWYLAQCATEIDYTLGEVAVANIAKLEDRQRRGVINGNGDRR